MQTNIFLSMTLLFLFSEKMQAQGFFTKITNPNNPITTFYSAGVYRGASWVDVNNDGKIDLFANPNYLFLNAGNGNFTPKSTPIVFGSSTGPSGNSWADIDNDGDIDLVVAKNPASIFFNDGQGNLTDSTAILPNNTSNIAWGVALADVDNDRDMDMVYSIANGFTGNPTPCKYYKREGGIYQKITGYGFTDSLEAYTVPYWSDYDLDGDMDLFIASGPVNNTDYDHCYQNMFKETGNDTLIRLINPLFASQKQDGQCYNFIDIDNDLDLDVCITNYQATPTRMYRNNAGVYAQINASFCKISQQLSNCWGDYDNDGDLDVIITSDTDTLKMYLNDGIGNFSFSPTVFATQIGHIAGATNGDYDDDGDLDVFINGDSLGRALYRNDISNGNHAFVLKCVGVQSNVSAIGTKVKIKTTINGLSVWQIREILAQNNFQGQNDLRVHFGLSAATSIDSVIVMWISGNEQAFAQVAAGTGYALTEGGQLSSTNALFAPIKMPKSFQIFPNPLNDTFTLSFFQKNITSAHLTLIDMQGKIVWKKDMNTQSAEYPIGHLPAGNYILQVDNHGKIEGIKMEKR